MMFRETCVCPGEMVYAHGELMVLFIRALIHFPIRSALKEAH